MTMRRATALGLAAAGLLGLTGCDQVEQIMTEVSAKGGESDVPAEAREPLDPQTEEALRQRIQGQNFN
jgi:hypothetical protein